MNGWGATAVSFTLLSWVLSWWLLFELWPELRAARLRLRLRRMQAEKVSPELFKVLDAAARHAEEFRWLPLLLAPQREPGDEPSVRAAWEIVRHVAHGAPWLWLALISREGRQRWMRRAWGLAGTAGKWGVC
jgi:hypothetical protein